MFLFLGDVICDPLCGGGSIPIECAKEWPCSFNIAGDNFHMAPKRTQDNVEFVNKQCCSMTTYEKIKFINKFIFSNIVNHSSQT